MIFSRFNLFIRYLQSSPRERRVVICEDILCADLFRQTLALALFDRMQVFYAAIIFAIAALF